MALPIFCRLEYLLQFCVFSKSVLDIRTRLVVTVEPETKWMPNSDASELMPKCKILGQYHLPYYFENCCFLRFLYGFSI